MVTELKEHHGTLDPGENNCAVLWEHIKGSIKSCWRCLEECAWLHKYVTAVVVIGVTGYCMVLIFTRWKLAKVRKRRATECKRSMQQLIDKLAEHSEERHVEQITKCSFGELVRLLKDDKKTPADVLKAYQVKALEAHEKTNCLVEPINIKETDDMVAGLNPKKKGALYGVPVSLKDNIGVKDYIGDCGFARWINKPYKDDAVIVKVLKKQGAIPFVRTNVPQTMISFETTNPIHGATTNPHDKTRGVGGSSGGEAALIAAGGSPLGIGSDIGGSLRIPASMCGICALKPTYNRLSPKGTAPLLKGQTCVQASYGPLSKDVEGLVIVMKALLVPEMFSLDPDVPAIPFRDEMYNDKKPLRIGYFVDDGYFCPVPAMQRGLHEAKERLKRQGHTLVEWRFPDISLKATGIWGKALFGDGGAELLKLLRGDSIDSSFMVLWFGLHLPDCVKVAINKIGNLFYPTLARLLQFIQGQKTVVNWWKLMEETAAFREAVMADWKEKELDAVISPGLGCPALPFGHSAMATGVTSYTMLYNVLNFPAGSLPVTKVTKEDIDELVRYDTPDPWHRVVKKGMVGSRGLPVNVQVAALPWQDETVLRVMKLIEGG